MPTAQVLARLGRLHESLETPTVIHSLGIELVPVDESANDLTLTSDNGPIESVPMSALA